MIFNLINEIRYLIKFFLNFLIIQISNLSNKLKNLEKGIIESDEKNIAKEIDDLKLECSILERVRKKIL